MHYVRDASKEAGGRRTQRIVGLVLAALAVVAMFGLYFWTHSQVLESKDCASCSSAQ